MMVVVLVDCVVVIMCLLIDVGVLIGRLVIVMCGISFLMCSMFVDMYVGDCCGLCMKRIFWCLSLVR